MPTPKIRIAPERVAEGKHLYELTATPVADIATMMGISHRTLERRVHEWGWRPRSGPRVESDRALLATPPETSGAPVASTPEELRRANAMRIQTIVSHTLDGVQRVLDKSGPGDEGGAERTARTLAAIARTLQEMHVLTQPDEVAPTDDADNDPVPLDIDEFRNELARRIHALIDAQQARERGSHGGIPGQPEPPGS